MALRVSIPSAMDACLLISVSTLLSSCVCLAFLSQFDCANAYVRPAFDGMGSFPVHTTVKTPKGGGHVRAAV